MEPKRDDLEQHWRDYTSSDEQLIERVSRESMQKHTEGLGMSWTIFLERLFYPRIRANPIIRILDSKEDFIGYYWLFDIKETQQIFGYREAVFLNSVIVDRSVQRKGFGSLMLHAAISHARDLGGKVLKAYIQKSNDVSYSFFVEKHGFKVWAKDSVNWKVEFALGTKK